MTARAGLPVIALTAHARDVPAEERLAVASRLREVLPEEHLLLETCHRVEAYLVTDEPIADVAERTGLPPGGRALAGADAARHLVSVAVGRDSVVVGEDQILHQLRTAVTDARRRGGLDATLDRIATLALAAGRRARSWQRGPERSLADRAVRIVEARTGALAGRPVLVVGAGRMGVLAARAAVGSGAVVSIASRSAGHASQVASLVGGVTAAWDPGAAAGPFAAVVVALAGPWTAGEATRDAIAASSAVVVDLSVPSATPAVLAGRLGNRLVGADDIARLAPNDAEPDEPRGAARAEALIESTVQAFAGWVARRDGHGAAELLVRRANEQRERELAALWRRLPELDGEARRAIEGMTRHLAQSLLREPLERLGRDDDGRDGRAVRELFGL